MALPKPPSLQEVWANPSLLETLPLPMAEAMLERIRQVESALAGATNVPPNPVLMATQFPKFRWMDTRHIHYLGEEVAAAVDNNRAIVVTMPPRHAKSHTCSVWTPFWFLCRRPDAQVLFISNEAGFARKWGIKVRGLVEMYGAPFGLYIDPKQTAGDDWALTTGGGMKCVGALGGISGNPAKLLIVDDAIKNDADARSVLLREQLWDWWEGTVIQRIEPDTTVIIIGTRYHEDDLIGRILAASVDGTGIQVEEITLRAKAESDDPLGREPGEGLWTNHPLPDGTTWGQAFYDKREADTSAYTWSAVYQQRPTPPGGNMVDASWWKFVLPQMLPETFDQQAQSWDLALDATKKTDSFHAGLLVKRKDANIYLFDGYHEHGKIASGIDHDTNEAEKTVISQIRQWNLYHPGAQVKLVERAIAGPMLIQTLQNEITGLMPWPPKGHRKGSKEANLNACVPVIKSGNCYVVLNPDGSKPRWFASFSAELQQFPRAPNDDWVDCFTQIMAFMLPGVRAALGLLQKLAPTYAPRGPQNVLASTLHSILQKRMAPQVKAMQKAYRKMEMVTVPTPFRGMGRRGSRGPRGLC